MPTENLTFAIEADISSFQRQLEEAERLSGSLGRSLSAALEGAAMRGKGLENVMASLASRLSRLALDAAFRPVEQGLNGLFQNIFQGLNTPVTPFAQGGVIASPGFFPTGSGIGLAGEAGPEAIIPLARSADGKLGVRNGEGARPMSVTLNISTPDAASFRRSEAYVTQMIARAVARGERNS